MAQKDYYQILGVGRSSGGEEIKKSYKRLARKYHPDVNPGDRRAEEKFKEVSEAYAVLSDPEKRRKYDSMGYEAFRAGFDPFEGFRWEGGPFWQGTTGTREGGYADLGDLFEEFFGVGRRRTARRASPKPGRDLSYSMELDFLEAAKGTTKTIVVQRDGSFGREGKRERLSVRIPEGMEEGSRIRLAGKGEPGEENGPPGDLYIVTHMRPHPVLRREGQNVLVELPLTVAEAGLGTKVEVPTIDGIAQLTIPPGTSSAQTFRLKGKGIADPKRGGRGDQLVKVKIVLPKKLDKRSEELLEEFARLNPDNPRAHLLDKT